jgi:predicted sugar kinase
MWCLSIWICKELTLSFYIILQFLLFPSIKVRFSIPYEPKKQALLQFAFVIYQKIRKKKKNLPLRMVSWCYLILLAIWITVIEGKTGTEGEYIEKLKAWTFENLKQANYVMIDK